MYVCTLNFRVYLDLPQCIYVCVYFNFFCFLECTLSSPVRDFSHKSRLQARNIHPRTFARLQSSHSKAAENSTDQVDGASDYAAASIAASATDTSSGVSSSNAKLDKWKRERITKRLFQVHNCTGMAIILRAGRVFSVNQSNGSASDWSVWLCILHLIGQFGCVLRI